MFVNCFNNNVFLFKGEDSGVYDVNLLCDLFMLFNFLEYWFWVFDEIWLCINSCER